MSKPKKQGRDAARPENKSSSEEIVALVKERRKYADWIAALDAKKDQTPPAVYSKVRLDYDTRLQAAIEKLESHRDALAEEQAALQRKLEGVEGQIEHHQEQRAETELRAQIGELRAAALTEALRESDTELERLEDKRDALEADLARLADFFAALDGSVGPTGRTSAPRVKARDFDELSFLQSVVGDKPTAPKPSRQEAKAESPPPLKPVEVPAKPPVEVPAPRPEPTPAPEPKPEPKPDPKPEPKPEKTPEPAPVREPPRAEEKPAEKSAEVAQADGVVEKPKDAGPPPAPKPVPRQSIAMTMASLTMESGTGAKAHNDLGIIKTGDELPPSILADLTPGASGEKPLAANVASNNPLSLKGNAPSDLKTLKCRECGTMNDPSEWYCEKCGAELSAI
jgi:hypothetical protein